MFYYNIYMYIKNVYTYYINISSTRNNTFPVLNNITVPVNTKKSTTRCNYLNVITCKNNM